MANNIYTAEEIIRYLQNTDSDVELFSDESDDEYRPDNEDEDRNDVETTNFIPSNSAKNDELPLQPPANSTLHNITDITADLEREWRADVLPIGRETFTGKKGTQNIDAIMEDGQVSLTKIYRYFLPDELIDDMVIHTNNYAQMLKCVRNEKFDPMATWTNVTREDMKIFFGIVMYMDLISKPTIEHYWKKDIMYYNPLIDRINMSYNRFIAILCCWHFTEVQLDLNGELRTNKIDPLINKVVQNFRSLYIPSDIIVVDESMVNSHGKSKTDRSGMKIYKACSINNYTWSYEIYSRVFNQLEGLDKPGSTIVQLTEPLLDEGRVIVADEYFTSIPLAEYLKGRRTDLYGPLRKNRKYLPEEVVKAKLRKGNQIVRQKDNLYTVLKWRDKSEVLMVSTCHGDGMSKVTTKRDEAIKPELLIDYNETKKSIDISDQLSSFHSPLHKSLNWYKKIAIDLLFQVAVINTRCIYNEMNKGPSLSILQVQEYLVRYFLGQVASVLEPIQPPRVPIFAISTNYSGHKLQEIPRRDNRLIRKRCTGCYATLRLQGDLARKAKQVNTECKECKKAFCLDCYNKRHS